MRRVAQHHAHCDTPSTTPSTTPITTPSTHLRELSLKKKTPCPEAKGRDKRQRRLYIVLRRQT